MKFFDPTGVSTGLKPKSSPLIFRNLEGKSIGILSNGWASYESMTGRFREELLRRHKVSRINYYATLRVQASPDSLLDKICAECDAAIVGLGN